MKLRMLLVAGVVILAGAVHGQRQWKAHDEGGLSVVFADSLTGWAAGRVKTGGLARDTARAGNRGTSYRTMMLRTTDGGSSWHLQSVIQTSNQAVDIIDVCALDDRHAWALASESESDRNFLLRTTNGRDWSAILLRLDARPKHVSFVDAENGILIANEFMAEDHVYRTTDGGMTWSDHPIGYSGTYQDVLFTRNTGYILATLNGNPSSLTILKSNDGGQMWIVGSEVVPDPGRTLEGVRLVHRDPDLVVLMGDSEQGSDDPPQAVVLHSNDGLASQNVHRVAHDADKKSETTSVRLLEICGNELIGVDDAIDDVQHSHLIVSSDFGRTWHSRSTLDSPPYQIASVNDRTLVIATLDGEIRRSTDSGGSWQTAEINFKGVFHHPPHKQEGHEVSPISFAYEMDAEDIDRDTVYSSRWDSEADSMLAVSATRTLDANRYRLDETKDFSVGLDSLYTTQIVFHKRIRRGAKHKILDLVRQESQKGEIRLRKFKTVRFAGAVRAVNGKKPVKYSWSSSINGELSDELAFTTSPRQLFVGTHYIFFKAMEASGTWSEPVVVKVIVEDFPKLKFPFYGTWTVGGGGSYYNQGRHVRGIRYALDLNYAEGQDGGDSDYGIPVRASTDGVVSFAGYVRGYGRTVKVDYMHGGRKYTTLVTHLAAISVKLGEQVKQGQEVGTCGSTGRSSAPHVHWELRVDDVCSEPEPVFENDSTVVQMLRNGGTFTSDNAFQPDHILVVDEPVVDGTWLERRGYNHSYRWVHATKNTATVECVWRPEFRRSGTYEVQVHIPKKFATAQPTYRVHSRNGVTEIKVNQNKYTDEWVSLGTFEFDSGTGGHVSVTNATGQVRRTVALDAVRFIGQWFRGFEVGLDSTRKQ